MINLRSELFLALTNCFASSVLVLRRLCLTILVITLAVINANNKTKRYEFIYFILLLRVYYASLMAKGLIRYHMLFVIRLATREVQIAGLVA
jgi:hypothetical protein